MCTLPVICDGGSWPASRPASKSEDQFLGKWKQTQPYKLAATSGTASATPPPCFLLQPQLLQLHWADAEMSCPTYSISSVLPHVQKENKLALATYQLNFWRQVPGTLEIPPSQMHIGWEEYRDFRFWSVCWWVSALSKSVPEPSSKN